MSSQSTHTHPHTSACPVSLSALSHSLQNVAYLFGQSWNAAKKNVAYLFGQAEMPNGIYNVVREI